jgi:hypothetical protein
VRRAYRRRRDPGPLRARPARYIDQLAPSDRIQGYKLMVPIIDPAGPGDELGFTVLVTYNSSTTGDTTVSARGTWAYTAP